MLLFASLREAVGQKQLELELPADATLAELVTRLEQEHAILVRYRGRLLVSLNEERAPLETQLGDGDEVALLPPVSGGSERAWIDDYHARVRRVLSPKEEPVIEAPVEPVDIRSAQASRASAQIGSSTWNSVPRPASLFMWPRPRARP